MKEVATYFDAFEAQIALGFLEAQGISAEIADYHTLSARPELRFGGNYFRLLVAEHEFHRAKLALQSAHQPTKKNACPRCRSSKVDRRAPSLLQLFPALIAAFFRSRSPLIQNVCTECGNIWKDNVDEPQ